MKKKNASISIVCIATVVAVAVISLFSCNKEVANKYNFKDTQDSIYGSRSQKVLYVILDGARGLSIVNAQTPTLVKMAENAIYTANGVSDEGGLEATSWTDMLTGVAKVKHKVTTANFANNNLVQYPMFFKRIKETTNLRTAAFCASATLSQNLISSADANLVYNTDAEVKDATLNELGNDNAAVVLAEFKEIDKAGAQYGYDVTVPQYATAIANTDAYIAALLAKLKTRKNYATENWLVVVASNKGGAYGNPTSDGTLFSNPLLNNFVLLYNPNFALQYYDKPNTAALPYAGTTVQLTGATKAILPADKASVFNFGTGIAAPEYTFEMKLKVVKFGTQNADIFSKSTSPANSSAGWWIIHSGSAGVWRLGGFGGVAPATNINSSLAPALEVGKWYTLGFKIYVESGKRWLVLFQDGKRASSPLDITAKNVDNNVALTAGYIGGFGNTATQCITDVRLFKAAIPDNVIQENFCKVKVTSDHPYYNKLVGYWPCLEGKEAQFKDQITTTNNFDIATATWSSFEDTDPKFCIPVSPEIYAMVPRSKDIPLFILAWLNIKTNTLNLDGKLWIPTYKN